MSAPEYDFVAITNIPHNFHAADLRCYFTTFVESQAFICFHYRHRPEKSENLVNQNATASKSLITKRCCVTKIKSFRLQDFIKKYNNELWTDSLHEYHADRCHVSEIRLNGKSYPGSDNSPDCVEEAQLLAMPEMKPPNLMPYGNVGTPTSVFFDFIQRCLLPDKLVQTLKLKFPKMEGKRLYSNVEFEYPKCNARLQNKCMNFMSKSSLLKSQVSTSGNDSNNSNCTTGIKSSESVSSSSKSDSATEENTTSETTDSPTLVSNPRVDENKAQTMTKKDIKRLKRLQKSETFALMNENIEEGLIAVEKKYHNDEDAEEWDRHEAIEDDPSNQERNKERLYDGEEIEQPWEKGGPGVLFYTDAVYWKAQEGDFDEQTADDLDVDFSPYEGDSDGRGDKDIRDFLKIRQEQRFRSGYDKTDRFSIGIASRLVDNDRPTASAGFATPQPVTSRVHQRIGQFDVHTKGFGRKILEKQGWQDGQGLGKKKSGIAHALKGKGQKPKVKTGLGFIKPKVTSFVARSATTASRSSVKHSISTTLDNPRVMDPKEPLLQRHEPTTLKHRKSVLDSFPSEDR